MTPLNTAFAFDESDPDLEGIIQHSRYDVEGFLGRGYWGEVYLLNDNLLNKKVAGKVLNPIQQAMLQLLHRDMSLDEAIIKEAEELTASEYVVPRKLEIDENGKGFIVTPVYNKFLSDVLSENGERYYIGYGLSEETLP